MPYSSSAPVSAAPDLVALQTITIAGAAATIDFTGIPQAYTHLKIIGTVRGSDAGGGTPFRLRFNNDATAGRHHGFFHGVTAGAIQYLDQGVGTSAALGTVICAGGSAGAFDELLITISNYKMTTQRAAIVQMATPGGLNQWTGTAQYNQTGPITQVTLFNDGVPANFAIGSAATLYGLK